MSALNTLFETFKGKKTGHFLDLNIVVAEATTTEATEPRPSEHLTFLKGRTTDIDVKTGASDALNKAKINRQPSKFFEELNGFTVDLTTTEAERLRTVPSVESVEPDRPLPLTPPVEVKPVSSSVSTNDSIATAPGSSAFDQEVSLEKVFVGEGCESPE